MNINLSGYYAWQANPESRRQKQETKFLSLIKQSWLESASVYGYRKMADDLRDIGAKCCKYRVYKLMRQAKLVSQRGYNRRPYMRSGAVAQAAPNRLEQNFTVPQHNQAWVTDITYNRTHEGWLYLAAVIDLFSRQVVGWSMCSRIDTELVINALLMVVWRRKPEQQVIVHSDQGCQFTSKEWQDFLITNRLVCSMSRRGYCTTMRWLKASLSYSSGKEFDAEPMKREIRPEKKSLITSRCFSIESADTHSTTGCRLWILKINFFRRERVSS